jgi:predicted ArsR family transcriptional regulator
MPVTETGDVSKRSAGMKQVMQALLDLEEASTDEIVDHDEVEITESQVRKHLNALDEEGAISYQKEGRGGKWVDRSLDNTNPDTRVHLP